MKFYAIFYDANKNPIRNAVKLDSRKSIESKIEQAKTLSPLNYTGFDIYESVPVGKRETFEKKVYSTFN